jgi:hypothetical protein
MTEWELLPRRTDYVIRGQRGTCVPVTVYYAKDSGPFTKDGWQCSQPAGKTAVVRKD